MAREKLSDELKKAIKALPIKEKDKLLLRLIPSNEILVRQLEYRLLEEEQTLEERKEDLETEIKSVISEFSNTEYPAHLLHIFMKISSAITRHVRITGDKLGDVELNLLMLNEGLQLNKKLFSSMYYYDVYRLNLYIIKRLNRVIKQIDKLHEDYRLEFEDHLLGIQSIIDQTPELLKVQEDLEEF